MQSATFTTGPTTAQALLAAIVESSTDAIVSRDLDGAITGWNRAATRLFGYEADEVLGGTTDLLVPPDRKPAERALLERVLAGERVENAETERLRKSGELVEVSATLSPIQGPSGEVVGVASIERDVSARRAAERERDALFADLERSNNDLEQFAYVASHDLSEPLRAVAGMIDLLARRYEGELDETAHDYINRAVAGTQRMQSLITDLLVYSRAGRGELALEECDTAALMQDTADALAPALGEAGVELTVSRLPVVTGDRSRLSQVFQNVVANAIKFAGEDPPVVDVSAARGEGEWLFSVRDNGIGIAPRHRERVFKIFKRLHGRDEYPGTGIGLALCKRIVEAHDGRIWVGDADGPGTVVHFAIPDREPRS